jgi:hypothetical protein
MESNLSVMVVLKGGAGSGFFGHRGRPGEEGGSLPRGSSSVVILKPGSMLFQQPGYEEKFKKLVRHSYFHKDKHKVLNEKLETSLQQQYEVLGFDPLEMIRRGRNKIYLQDDYDFEKSLDYYNIEYTPTVIGCVTPGGSIHLACGRWTPYLKNGELSDYDLYDALDIDTINHEFGHVLQNTTNPGWYIDNLKGWEIEGRKAQDNWMTQYVLGVGQHTNYSKKSGKEGFAESYMSYVATGGVSTDPEVSKTYEAVKKVIDAARLKYAK